MSDQDESTTEKVDINKMFADQLASIKNDQGSPKYSSVEDALKALQNSQEHIKKLEVENQNMREKESESKAIDDILLALNSKKEGSDDSQNRVDPEAIKKLVELTFSEKEKKMTAANNKKSVIESLAKKFGDKAEEKYLSRAQELGMSVEDMDSLAKQSPKAALAFFSGMETAVTKNITSSVNTTNFMKSPPQKPKSVMFGASSEEMLSTWRQAAASVNAGNN